MGSCSRAGHQLESELKQIERNQAQPNGAEQTGDRQQEFLHPPGIPRHAQRTNRDRTGLDIGPLQQRPRATLQRHIEQPLVLAFQRPQR